jgi:hypothetical protein
VAAVPPSQQGQSLPGQAKIRLGFGLIKESGRLVPIHPTRELLAMLGDLIRHKAVTVMDLDGFLTDSDLADLFQVDQRTIRRFVQRKWLDYIDLGDGRKELRRYPVSWVKRFIELRSKRHGVGSDRAPRL